MWVEKWHRNHRTGVEVRRQVEKPDDVFLRGVAHLQTVDREHGDIVEEAYSPNIVTNYVKDQLGRFLFNSLVLMSRSGTSSGGALTATTLDSTYGGIGTATGAAALNGVGYLHPLRSAVLTSAGSPNSMVWPFQQMFLSAYDQPESATEIWVPNTVTPLAGTTRNTYLDPSNPPTQSECSVSADGNTITFVWDYAPANFTGTFQSIHFARAALVNYAQFARTLLASPVTKDGTQSLKLTYSFTLA